MKTAFLSLLAIGKKIEQTFLGKIFDQYATAGGGIQNALQKSSCESPQRIYVQNLKFRYRIVAAMYYLHTQKVPAKVLTIASVAGLAASLTVPGLLLRLGLIGTMGAVAATFRSLTIEVDDTRVALRIGDGLIKKDFPLEQIDSAQVVRTALRHGWGIHWIGDGWLYNIYGLSAVELSFTNGQRVVIGSDEAEKLAAAVNENLGKITQRW